jgi:hypothetical protein
MSGIMKAAFIVGSALAIVRCADKGQTFSQCRFKAQSAHPNFDKGAAFDEQGSLTQSCMLAKGYELETQKPICLKYVPYFMRGQSTLFLFQGEPACYSPLPGHWWLGK